MPKKFLVFTAFILMFALLASGCGSDKNSSSGSTGSGTAQAQVQDASKAPETTVSVTETAEISVPEEPAASEESSEESEGEILVPVQSEEPSSDKSSAITVTEDGTYTDKEHVALYIYTYGHLPDNYISKYDAEDAGWNNREGNLWDVCPGMSIGGNKFGNYEGLLPTAKGRKYYECDIDYEADYDPDTPDYRGEKRIIYSNDGLVYYTEDHYQSFELLYGEP